MTIDAGDGAGSDKVMTLVEHLSELRLRIFISLLAVGLASIVGFILAPEAIRVLTAPISQPVYAMALGSAFFLRVKIALMIGVAIASPFVLYQFWAFVAPGLTPRERSLARPWIPLAFVFLVLGVGVAYVILPFAAAFLLSFEIPGVVEPLISADAYFGFVTTMFLAFGLVMQFPIFLVLLVKVGILNVDRLRRSRRYVFLGILIFAVVVTPGGDPYSPTVMTAVMYPLYELTIWLLSRSRRNAAADG